MSHIDPIFELERPAFFAHRGGAAEAPQSSIESFIYSLKQGAQIIEVDLQLTQDEEIVVWHGPELDITYNKDDFRMKGQYVHCWKLADLQQLTIMHPCEKTPKPNERRRIISLEELITFLKQVRSGNIKRLSGQEPIHLNLELKRISKKGSCDVRPSWTAPKKDDYHPILHKLLTILKEAPPGTRIVVGSGHRNIIEAFRHTLNQRSNDNLPYIATNLAALEQLPYIALLDPSGIKYLGWLSPLLKALFKLVGLFAGNKEDLTNKALETPAAVVTRELVQEVHRRGGGVYVFLSPFGLLDQPEVEACRPFKTGYEERIEKLLRMGVDGFMTDYPAKLAAALRKVTI